jgi:hypothetical protein
MVLDGPDLRYVKLGNREVIRRIYFAIRNHNWDTIPGRLSNVRTEVGDDSFKVSYECHHQEKGVDFVWEGTITGHPDGALTFAVAGEARSTFLRNRIGICVLHPVRECAGNPCRIERVDGTIQETSFPRYISPHQPFLDIRAMSHQIISGTWAEVKFEGEVFETEDQRNWTDASFKTYSTPLRLPYPVRVEAGTTIKQAVRLSLKGSIPQFQVETGPTAVTFAVGNSAGKPLPAIGLAMASHGQSLSARELSRLRALHLSHLRVDVNLMPQTDWSPFIEASRQAAALGVRLETAITVHDSSEDLFPQLRAVVDRLKPDVSSWLIFNGKVTEQKWIDVARRHLAGYEAKFGGGANHYFVEINRNRSPVKYADLLCYIANPQVHAVDNRTMVENLEGQGYTLETAHQFADNLPLAVTPVTLKPRFNPDALSPVGDELPANVDVRQISLLGAGWTTGSLKYLAENGAASVTYFETTGWRGVMETAAGCPLPGLFRSLPGAVFPLYHVLADAGEFGAGRVIDSTSSHPLFVDGLVLRHDQRTRIILANFRAESQKVQVTGIPPMVYVKTLDESSAERAMTSPEAFREETGSRVQTGGDSLSLEIPPLGIVRIDSRR